MGAWNEPYRSNTVRTVYHGKKPECKISIGFIAAFSVVFLLLLAALELNQSAWWGMALFVVFSAAFFCLHGRLRGIKLRLALWAG